MRRLVLIVALCCIFIVSTKTTNAANESENLPLLWPAISPDRTYRISYQFQGTDLERVAIEEWASFNSKKFRLDLIKGRKRISFLTYGQTNEYFRYEPFGCAQLEADSPELGMLGTFLKGYRMGSEADKSSSAYGLGPLWLKARYNPQGIRYSPHTQPDYRLHPYFRDYDSYDVGFNESESIYNLRFYFRPGDANFPEAIEWLSQSKGGEPVQVVARARLLWSQLAPFDDSVFELPIGYGCQRRGNVDAHVDSNMGLDLMHDYLPNQAVLEVVASKALDQRGDSWSNHRSLVHLMRGSMMLNEKKHEYYVSKIQARDSGRNLQRTKRVWSTFADEPDHALVYTINEKTGDCMVSQTNVKNLIELPMLNTVDGESDNKDLGSLAKMFMSLELSTLQSLFNDHVDQTEDPENGYHLVSEKIKPIGPPDSSRYDIRQAFYERTAKNYDVKGSDGSIIWSGPISIVKKIESLNMYRNKARTKSILQHYHASVTLLFYDIQRKSLVYKVTLNLLDNDELDVGLMIKQMDIGSCFDERDKQDVIVRYQIESQKMANQFSQISDIVQERFLLILLSSTPLLPFQLSGIDMKVNNFFLDMKFTLLDLPLTQTYRKTSGMQLKIPPKKNKDDKSSIIQVLAASLDRCSMSCDFYRCYRFSYQRQSLQCRLELEELATGLEESINSELYVFQPLNAGPSWLEYEPTGGRRHMKPSQVLELLSEMAERDGNDSSNDQSDGYMAKPMRIRIESNMIPQLAMDPEAPEFIELRPDSVISDMESVNELLSEQPDNWQAKTTDPEGDSGPMVRVRGDGSRLRIQYKILIEGRRFSEGRQSFEHVNLDECTKLCENSDCRSFSYCPMSMECILTNLHDTKSIQAASKADELCTISALDYLSKFESFGDRAPPTVVKKSIRDLSVVDDCASRCMEEESFNCESFHFCTFDNKEQILKSCYMHQTHIQEAAMPGSGILYLNPRIGPKTIECEFFSRSYLNHFDDYYGKQLKYKTSDGISDDTEASTELVVGLGAEECAAKCIRESGLAFHVCQDPHDPLTTVCEIAKKQVEAANLVSKDRCTAFVLSDRSQLNLRGARIVAENPDKAAREGDSGDEDQVIDQLKAEALKQDINMNALNWFWSIERGHLINESHWFAKMVSLLIGISVGLICALAWQQRDSIYNQVTRLQGHFRPRS